MARDHQPEERQQSRRWVVAAVTLAVNLGSFLYLVLVARSAPPAIFGALGALAALTLVFEVPANALQVAVGRTVSARSAGGRVPEVVAGPLLIEASAFGAGVCAVLLALSPLVERFLHLPSITSALLLGAYALPVGLSVVPKGVLAGQATCLPFDRMQNSLATRRAKGSFCSTRSTARPSSLFSRKIMSPIS